MGKKKTEKKAAAPLDKKARKALERREAELVAELEARAKKKSKKGKGKKPAPTRPPADPSLESEAVAAARAARKAARDASAAEATVYAEKKAKLKAEKAVEAAEAVIEGNSTDGAKASAEAALDRVVADDETDAQIKARVQAKRSIRLGLPDPDSIDRDDAEAVASYNAEAVKVGAVLLTSTAERERIAERETAPSARADEVWAQRDEDEKARAKGKEAKIERATLQEIHNGVPVDVTIENETAPDGKSGKVRVVEVEVVETDHGREFAVGTSVAEDEFAKPSEAPRRLEDNVNGNGQYKIIRPTDGKEVGYTRVTTYIDCLTDRSALEKWKARIILEGVAAIETLPLGLNAGPEESVIARIGDLARSRDASIAKARKDDRKGRLGLGELEARTTGAWSEFKKALDGIADEVFEEGGGREKAAKGTDIHELCAIAVKDGIDVIGEKLTAGEITPADLADVEAFLAALKKLDAKVIDIERVIVVDDLKVAGRLDYVLMVKLPGALRATRLVADLKTGRIDLGPGKIAQQLDLYSQGQGYDEATGEREDLKLNRTKALVFHLPAGSGKVTVHVVDLGMGRHGNKLAGEVRSWRNTSKKAIDSTVDLLTVESVTA